MLRCSVSTRLGRLVSIAAWMLDPVSCAAMRVGAEPHVSMSALEELRCLLEESGSLDTEPKPQAVTVHEEEAETKTCRSTGSSTTRAVASELEGASRGVAQGGRSTARGDSTQPTGYLDKEGGR